MTQKEATEFKGFDLSGILPFYEFEDNKDEIIEGNVTIDNSFIQKLENIADKLKTQSTYEISRQYKIFIESLPKHLKPFSIEETLMTKCCGNCCNFKFSSEFTMRARQFLPISLPGTKSIYHDIFRFHFMLIQKCFTEYGQLAAKINIVPVCSSFIQRVYIISDHRFTKICRHIQLGILRATISELDQK